MKRSLTLILLAMLLAQPSRALADVAPPARPPGSSLEPGTETTQVRMLAETVVLNVLPGASDKSFGLANVTADFTMRNLGPVDESMSTRFPIGASDGFFSVNEIRNLRIQVGGQQVSTRRITGEDPYNSSTPVPWVEFDSSYPAGQDVAIRVEYTLDAAGEYPFAWFKYILSSGAGWKDSIGSADIIVHLPYAATDENVLMDTGNGSSGTVPGGLFDGNSIRWHYDDFEPTANDNFEVNLVMPSAWESLLAEQDNVAKNPGDGESWGRLARLCKQMAFSSRGKGFRAGNTLDSGAEQLYQRSLQGYAQAVTLLPNDALWHAGYADLLAYHAYFEAFNGTDTDAEATHSLREIQRALQLAPDNSQVQQIAETIAYSFPQGMQQGAAGYAFPWLTATPVRSTPTLSSGPIAAAGTPAVISTSTAEVAPTSQPQGTSTAQPASPICGTALLLPLIGLLLAGRAAVRPTRSD